MHTAAGSPTRVSPVEGGRKDGPLLLHEVALQQVLGDGGEGKHVDAVDVLDVVAEPFGQEKEGTKISETEQRVPFKTDINPGALLKPTSSKQPRTMLPSERYTFRRFITN